ncbi:MULTISPECIES: helix-turn-helix domain-containing protein [Enterobacter]|uniref:helix-turn-helix domain-containing protein n=1 Tax=Enterobacter TaxID=547 RepID=UPI0013CFA6B0|nr:MULTISPECIES: helix-turn-helix domain-containing protein [Enterobacter]NMD68621.1 cyclic nucleotide-binding domain-containing protein [Enterobacter sp. DNRA5]GFM11817.1 hypothetical protein NCT2013_42350 [Enterobacter sp. M4-VN]
MITYNDNQSVSELANYLTQSHNSYTIISTEGNKIFFEQDKKAYIYYLMEGEVSVNKKIDDLVVINIKSPAIIGMTALIYREYFHYLVTISNCKIVAIPNVDVIDILDKNNLWRAAFNIVSTAARYYYERDDLLSSTSSGIYGLVRKYLLLINEYSMEEKERISVFDYIMKRNNVSRSSLNKILKELTVGKYITIKRGRLVSIDKPLPDSY